MTPSVLRNYIRRVTFLAALGAAASASACGGHSAYGQNTEGAALQTAAGQEQDDHAVPGFPSPAVLGALNLSPPQQQGVAAIQQELTGRTATTREARKAFAEALAAGLEKGAIDRPQTDARIEDVARAAEADKGALQDAMNKLHAALTPDQRKALVAAVRSDWKHGHSEAAGPRQEFRKLADEIGMTADQRHALKEQLGKEMKDAGHAMRAKRSDYWHHLKAIGQAFPQEQFDAHSLDVGKDGPEMARFWGARAEHMAEAATQVLTPPQRAELAAKIREKAAAP